jgi:nucleoside phosphorylase/tetratricopeptide (TPR) repeat protein
MRPAHVVILTALKLEYDAVLEVSAGAWPGSEWVRETGPNGLPVAFRTFRGKGGRPLRVAVGQAGNMAGVAAVNALLPLVDACRARCIAMCGVCAGHPEKTNLGDVVAADRLFFHDMGKLEPGELKRDIQTYNLREDWKLALDHFDFKKRFEKEDWWLERPLPYEWQENWVLAMLHQGVTDPAAHPERERHCAQWETVIEALWKNGHVQDGTLTLTEEGRKRIGRLLIKHRNQLPDLSPAGEVLPFKVQVAPMGSGNQVIEDKAIWDDIALSVRKTLGVEMEAAAIGAVAHSQRDKKLEALVMKGVMDFANKGRDDNFKKFAARASAECLIAFLREHFEPETIAGVDDILVPGTAPLPENPPPSALLNAMHEVIPFHEQGRESILAELTRWSDEGPPVAARLLHAEGGVGKTRLAIELNGRRRDQGWVAGFLAKQTDADWFERLCACGQPVLAVIDYAESHSELREVLLRVLRYAQQEDHGSPRRIRLLLLARNAGDWWQSLLQSDAALGQCLVVTPPHELKPLAPQVTDREKVFHEAAERFAREKGKTYQRRATVPLTDVRFERVLYLHMAALAAIEGLDFAAQSLMNVVLEHEERFWETRAKLDEVSRSFQKFKARQVMAAATLRGGIADFDTAVRVAKQMFREDALSANEEVLLRLLQRVYQRSGAEGSMFLPPLQPDLLGEGMVLRIASPPEKADRLAPDWITRVFPPSENAGVVGTGFEVLGRASASSDKEIRPWLELVLATSLQERARIALVAAKAVGLRTAFSVLGDVLADQLEARGNAQLAEVLDAVGIPESTVSLRRVAAWVSRTLLQALGDSGEEVEQAELARLQNNLGNRLSELGRREEALAATQEAVALRRVLAQRNPDAFQPHLAGSLNSLGNRLSELGRREEALAATQEAVEVYRVLAQRNPDAFQPDLAASLNNLGLMLSELGRREEALAATQEAVALRRVLAQRNPDAFQPNLAASLNNLGAILSELRRNEEALAALEEALDNLWPFFIRLPPPFMRNVGIMIEGLARAYDELQRPAPVLFVERVEEFMRLAGHKRQSG